MKIVLEEPAFPDLDARRDDLVHVVGGGALALLERGMESGSASVMLRVDLPDGRVLLYETSMALLGQAVDVFRARLGGDA